MPVHGMTRAARLRPSRTPRHERPPSSLRAGALSRSWINGVDHPKVTGKSEAWCHHGRVDKEGLKELAIALSLVAVLIAGLFWVNRGKTREPVDPYANIRRYCQQIGATYDPGPAVPSHPLNNGRRHREDMPKCLDHTGQPIRIKVYGDSEMEPPEPQEREWPR